MKLRIPITAHVGTFFPIIHGPVWQDHCEHGLDAYVCSFTVTRASGGVFTQKEYDLYLFDQPTMGTEVCIRYGNKDSEYISPGRLGDFMSSSGWHNPEYREAQRILKDLGTLTWTPKITPNQP